MQEGGLIPMPVAQFGRTACPGRVVVAQLALGCAQIGAAGVVGPRGSRRDQGHVGPKSVPPAQHQQQAQFHGLADNLMVFNRALTAEEIVSLLSPRLKGVRTDTALLVHWSVDLNGYRLEYTQELSGTNTWRPVTNRPVVIGNQYLVVQDMSGPRRFYRLMRP